MFEHLKRLAARLRSSPTWWPPPPLPPADPDIGVREPKWRRPSSGSAAVAVAEPDDQSQTSSKPRARQSR
jgi:hypothetical protein